MRLLKDCTILRVGDEDGHGPGVKVWDASGFTFLGRFQDTGMKVREVEAMKGDPEGQGDTLIIFTDPDHRDAHWQAFRDLMLHRHRVYIPDDLHTPECDRNFLMLSLLWIRRWGPAIACILWAVIPITNWLFEIPISFPFAGTVALMSILLFIYTLRLRKGMI